MSQPKFYKTKTFDKLNKQWQKKLSKSGFEDIEQSEDYLKQWSFQIIRKRSLINHEFKAAYYYMATHFLNDHTFDTNLDRSIWEYHSEGISVRNISKLLAKVKIKMNKDKVWLVVNKLETIMFNLYNNGSNE